MNRRIAYVLVILQLMLMVPGACFAHNGSLVSLIRRDGPLYYRICALHQIPIRYYLELSFINLTIRVNNQYYSQNGGDLVRRALDQWVSATAMPGQPPCTFEQVNDRGQADLVFETRTMDLPYEILDNTNVDSYRSRTSELHHVISILPRRVSTLLQDHRYDFASTPVEEYVSNYLFARMLHLTGHALGLDHPGFEESLDVFPRTVPGRDRTFFQADHPTDWIEPHIMSSDTFGYLRELQQNRGRPVVRNDIRPAGAENQALNFYLVREWQCMAPSAYSTASSWSSSSYRCLPRPPWLGLQAVYNLLL